MSKSGILLVVYFAVAITTINGRPTSSSQPRRSEIKATRKNILKMKNYRPCQARYLEVKTDLLEFKEIHSDPHYIPECTNNGTLWRQVQCDHHQDGSCFCVHKENGEIIEHTKNKNLHKEALSCGRRAVKGHDGHKCVHMQDEFTHKQEEYGLQGHAPLFYYPECTVKGKFKALQRNDRTFFCVDTENGELIPDTETKAGTMPPLTEEICRAYDEVWNKWKETRNIEEEQTLDDAPVTKESCKPGFTYTDCGCPVKCTHDITAESVHNPTCICKQACVCPKDMVDLDGKCVSLEECNEAKPQTTVLQANKLQDLSSETWEEFQKHNLNAVLETYNVQGMEEMVYAGGPVAYDQNPNQQPQVSEPPPEEEGDFTGAEEIPGEEQPYMLEILRETGDPDQEQLEYIERTHVEEEEFPTEEQEQEQRENFPEEEIEWEHFPEEENGWEHFPEEENGWEHFPDEEVQREEHFGEENNVVQPPEEEMHENVEETPVQYPNRERYVPPSEEDHYIEPEEPTERLNKVLPEEENVEPEGEVDERMENERMIEHQIEEGMEFSSVPRLRDEEIREHQTPPCDESEVTPSTSGEEFQNEDEAMAEINRVLSENGILVEAKFEKPTPSIKKNSR